MDRSIHPYFLDRLFFCSPSHCIIESEIDNGRAKISGYGFLGIAGFFDRLFPWMGGSFQPRSSQLHREEKFNFSSSTLIYPHAGGYRTDIYTDELVVARFIFTGYFRRFTVNRFDRSFDPIFEFISLHVRLKCVTCIPAATNGWTLLSEYQCIVFNVYIYIL